MSKLLQRTSSIVPRVVSVWLPRWPILRLLAVQERRIRRLTPVVDPERPLILAVNAPGGPRIAALNGVAESLGLRPGDLVADARAKAGMLQVFPADPAADQAALQRLTLWATRYAPTASPWDEENGADGFFLDVTGAAHFFGGEEKLIVDLARQLNHFGLPARLAVASTAGAAWALSHFHPSPIVASHPEYEAEQLAGLPIEALRLLPDACTLLRRLGFKFIGSLIGKPRGPFAARFPSRLLERIDQMFGRSPEPFIPVTSPPTYLALRQLLEPITTQKAIVAIVAHLMNKLVPNLIRDGIGAKGLRLTLYRIDGKVISVDLNLSVPTRSPALIARLIALKLERIVDTIDAGFGFEEFGLTVTVPERMEPRQPELASICDRDIAEHRAALIDNLKQRLGPRSVQRLKPVASHIPERAEVACAPADTALAWPVPDKTRLRPILLLPRTEPVETVALIPEGLPKRFCWRGITHKVAHAQGPERIACEWWTLRKMQPTRDYYVVETEAGSRFWLYREGLYGRETASPRWFVHGHFV